MATLLLEPEFVLDMDSTIKQGPLLLEDGHVIGFGWPKNPPDQHIKLPNQVVMPGFVNAHSHSFQRALRGLVEKVEGPDDFWSWREKMYKIANHLNLDDLALLAELCFLEMIEAGFTHVGEFHYLHHDVGGKPYKDPLAVSKTIVKSAENAHINLCLLQTAYHRFNFGEDLKSSQMRFAHKNVDSFLALAKESLSLKNSTTDLGLAIHSVRAVPKDWFFAINEFAINHRLPLHIHASEQLKEVNDCLNYCGASPIKLLAENHLLAHHTTLVHATHLIDGDQELINRLKPNLCICPSTEKNLGDGMIHLKEISPHVSVCIGTDQHVRLDPFDEARSLEEQERLRLNKRAVLTRDGSHLYEALHKTLSFGGLKSLYPFKTPSILGSANLISIELPPEYSWHGPKAALDAIMLSYNPSKLMNVITNGHFVLQEKSLIGADKPYLIKNLKAFFKNIFSS